MSALTHLVVATMAPSPSVSSSPAQSRCELVTPSPGPGIGDTVSLAAPWQFTLPLLITALLGLATVIGVVVTLIQKHISDRRQQLWNRMQWALTAMTSSDPDAAVIGYLAVQHLVDSGQLPRKQRPPIALTTYDVQLLSQSLRALD